MRFLQLFVLLSFWSTAVVFAQDESQRLEAELEQARGKERVEILAQLVDRRDQIQAARALEYGYEALELLETLPDRRLERTVLEGMSWAYIRQNTLDSAQVYADRLRDAAADAGDGRSLAVANFLQGRIERNGGNYEASLDALKAARTFAEKASDPLLTADILNEVGSVYRRQGNPAQALAASQEALTLQEQFGAETDLSETLTLIGIANDMLGRYDEALRAHQRALRIRQQEGDRRNIAGSLHNMGIVSEHLRQYSEALEFYEQARVVFEEVGDRLALAGTLNNIGNIHGSLENDEQAAVHYEQALAIWESMGETHRTAIALGNLADVYERQQRYPDAIANHKRALEIQERVGDRHGIAGSLIGLATSYHKLGRHAEARTTGERALTVAREVGSWPLIRDAAEELSVILEEQGRPVDALAAYKTYKAAGDSVLNIDTRTTIADLQEQYRTNEQQQRIELLQRRQEVRNLWIAGLLIGLAFLVLTAFLLFNRYRLKSRAHRELEAAHQQLRAAQEKLIQREKLASLGQLTASIAHEIKNPLNFVNNFAATSNELAQDILDAAASGHIDEIRSLAVDLGLTTTKIEEHGKRADRIVRNMLLHARKSSDEKEPTDLNALVEESVNLAFRSFASQVHGFDCTVESHLDPSLGPIEVVPDEIGRVMLNLLGNAFYAVDEKRTRSDGLYTPFVKVSTQRRDDQVEIRIEDNGMGIPETIRDKIFEPFFTTKPTGKGTGLGLSLAYDIVTQGHGGRLEVKSTEGNGTVFTITLPVTQPAQWNGENEMPSSLEMGRG